MTAVLEERTQFRQIGNSLGVIVSANIRKSGGFSSGDEVTLSCPRPGVITINSVVDTKKDELESWNKLQEFISAHKTNDTTWSKEKNFKEILNEARNSRFVLHQKTCRLTQLFPMMKTLSRIPLSQN